MYSYLFLCYSRTQALDTIAFIYLFYYCSFLSFFHFSPWKNALYSLQIAVRFSKLHNPERWFWSMRLFECCAELSRCPWRRLHLASNKRCLFQAVCGQVMRGYGTPNSIMWNVLCMCVFMICIDSRAWQIGYKLGNILACKWNILACGSILGLVLNS